MNYREAVEAKRKAMVEQLLTFIESNPTAWEAGWYKVGGTPRNGKTGKAYNGLNALWLYLLAEHKGYTDPRWVTYQQAKDLKASVKAGEKSSDVFYWSWYDKKTKKPFDDATVKDMSKDERQKYIDENVRPVLKYYQVFNASQCNKFPKLDAAEQKEMPADERARQNATIESIIENSAAPIYFDGGNRAYYSPRQDSIHLPETSRFHSMQDYYATALHEIAHSTGHESRLNRKMISVFGTSEYAKEELRAELASVFMQLDYDISVEGKHFENHAAYLQSWLKSVRDDQKEFFAAVTDAEKISQYVGEHYLQAQADIVAEAGKESTKEKIKAEETVFESVENNEIYGLIYNWKGLKEENSLYTAALLKELDEAFVPEDRYDGAIAANKTYMAIKLTGKTQEETDQNVRDFLTGKYNEAGDIEYIEGWYWETVDENFFTGEKNETTLKYIDRLHISPEDLRMKEEYAIEQRQKKIDKIVNDIVNEGTENTTQGNWIINFDQFGEDEMFVREHIEDIAEALNKREEVADVIISENGIDTDYFTDYCPNIEEDIEDNIESVDYAKLVRDSVETEYQTFIAAEMKKQPTELIADSHIINFYQELHNFLALETENNVTVRDLQGLYADAPHIVSGLYDYFIKTEYASINSYSDISDLIQAYNDKYHDEIVEDRYNETPNEQIEQVEQQAENTREKYQLDFRLPFSNELLLREALKQIGYQRDYSVEEENLKRSAAAVESNLPQWTNEIRFIGTEGKTIEGLYGRTNNGIMLEATDITQFTTNGLTRDEANQIADIIRGFDVEVSMQQVQRDETLDTEGQPLRRDNLEQAQPTRQAKQAEQARQGEWYSIDLTPEQIGNEYEKSVMIRMPQGEYSSFVFFAPKNLVRGDEKDGTKKLSVRADWSYKLQNDGLQVELNGSELRAAFAGREVGKSAKRVAPRKRNRKRLDDLEANVPEQMKGLKNWCVFRTKYNPETERQEKFVISPTDGKWAKSNDPNTWVDFETALKYAEENDCAGLSFALDGKCGITCIDLDKSISKDGKLTDSAEKLTQELADTYAETSVSGNGIHIFVADDILRKTYKNRADLPDGEIEVYDSGRFISMTGNMRSKSNELSKCPTATMKWLHGTLGKKIAERENLPRGGVAQSDNDVIERIRRSKRGHDFDTLMSGGAITGDKSRDDMILLNMLAFFTDCDRSQMESIFLSSGRRADLGANGGKKSSNYLSRSIEKACSSLKTRISSSVSGGAGRAGARNR